MTTWRERIVAARERGQFLDEDKMLACMSWGACAVGEAVNAVGLKMPIVWHGSKEGPEDVVLMGLGNTFNGFGEAIKADDFDRAEALLDQIQDRVMVLKREARSA